MLGIGCYISMEPLEVLDNLILVLNGNLEDFAQNLIVLLAKALVALRRKDT